MGISQDVWEIVDNYYFTILLTGYKSQRAVNIFCDIFLYLLKLLELTLLKSTVQQIRHT